MRARVISNNTRGPHSFDRRNRARRFYFREVEPHAYLRPQGFADGDGVPKLAREFELRCDVRRATSEVLHQLNL